ncbi:MULTISPECIES: protein-L-isoaspartate(D-aspartate) O-methyltransferase [Chromohalobacter]|uniref:Protein-L-isoaspartate O-methyltransferase n=3 Tax=Chromohalobacter TaxID=42054 RepID=A0A1Q8TFE2_9GAMM|nr:MULTISPECIES: protein-L-isoaspartate(D-aspartate) O-methyltransferase [Chromohalobacter]NWO11349.1 protein-L-isoaspartate(D-aspartate) O-methyltransferase [Chromohalobacter salexigens]MCK0751781.1 protein-L-isoaspartate(D-aspartate) O-methyltransferase [Chromohalobacter japonicus]MCK0767609.1 protein-L-isoaspartate(D-aspartate) O-methyltransferase [Chromohalobacter canadensis]MCK2042831.1 protein-L-isoaspartate(D-aspartate) O-methyltransferase [Chromohalobacter moromii]MCK2045277.1 protein-
MHCRIPDTHDTHRLGGIGMTSQRTRNRLIRRLQAGGIQDRRVLDVMAREPRHVFLDEALAHRSYEDTALPLGHGQTLSQPWIVARMTELVLAAQPRRVLEVGTGSGYQTLILARLVESVWSIERIGALHRSAASRLAMLGAGNVRLRHEDGGHGWPQAAPFDVILFTACASVLPKELLDQLADGGELIAPLEDEVGHQWLTRVQRCGSTFERTRLERVRFVPLLEGVIK